MSNPIHSIEQSGTDALAAFLELHPRIKLVAVEKTFFSGWDKSGKFKRFEIYFDIFLSYSKGLTL